jgi:CNT family concentrative nucleoside transporter
LVACVNWMLSVSEVFGGPALSLERIFGWVFSPLAWVIGVEWNDAQTVGMLLGKKVVLNELVAYDALRGMTGSLAPRSFTIATFALCGFANFASVAVQIGGIGGLVPSRRAVIAQYGLRCMIGGALTTLMTACFAGMLL